MLLSMQDISLSRALRLRDPKAAAVLADPLKRRIVLSCVGRERAVAELATQLEMDLRRIHYHVGALVRRRLLIVSRTRRRAGRPIKFYRAAAAAFFVPSEIAVETPSAALARQMQESLLAAHRRHGEGMLYDLAATGEPRMRLIASGRPESEPSETWHVLSISAPDAQRLSRDIRALLAKYATRSSGTAWLIHFALCPAKPPRSRAVPRTLAS